jgi:outer membrane protein insertion porin family
VIFPHLFPPTLWRCAALALLCFVATGRAQNTGLQQALPGAGLVAETLQAQIKDRVDFTGQQAFTEAELMAPLAEEVRDIIEHGVSPARADDLAFYVGSFYRKAGFSKVTVDYEIRGEKVIIKINEGPRSLLGKIDFTGNKAVPAATLYEYMVGATPEHMAKHPEQFPYTSAEIDGGADRVRGLYLSMGYLKATVEASKPNLSKDGTRADVTIRIVEGPHYTIGDVQFRGDTRYSQEELTKALIEPANGPFAPGIDKVMARNLQSFYKAHGYYETEVVADADPAKARGGRVPVTFTITAKQLFRFGWSNVKNETEKPRLRPDFLPKRFAHLHGQTYDPDKLDETFREMLRTGLFENLRMTLTPENGDELRLDLTATEAKAKEIGFSVGAGSYEGVSVGIRLGDRNIFGSGRPLTFSADYSTRGLKGELLYVDPWFFDTRFGFRTRVYSESREEDGYSKKALGLRFDLTRKAMKHLELGAFLEGASVKVTNSTIDPLLLGPLDYQLATIGLTQTTDFRNDPINPARGFVFTTSFEFSTIDGEAAFTRSIARFSYYLPVGKSMLAFGARVGMIAPIVDELPIDVRFFNGGGMTVRSFAERQLGPKDSGNNPLGGDIYTVFNVEYTFPITGGLQGAVFVDAGNLMNDDAKESGLKVRGSEDMRYALGLGVRYALPIGPLRLDYGINPDRRADEEFGAFHFSFGFAF